MRRIAVIGTRPPPPSSSPTRWGEYAAIIAQLENWLRDLTDWILVSGGARGVDRVAEDFYDDRFIHNGLGAKTIHLPDVTTFGPHDAPLRRNAKIVADADEIHAWPSSWSRGTWHAVSLAKAAAKPCFVHRVTPRAKGLADHSVEVAS